jgi:hypothetical protein
MSIVMYFNKIVGNVASENFKCSLSYEASCNYQREEKKSGTSLGEDYLYWFELSLEHCISYL